MLNYWLLAAVEETIEVVDRPTTTSSSLGDVDRRPDRSGEVLQLQRRRRRPAAVVVVIMGGIRRQRRPGAAGVAIAAATSASSAAPVDVVVGDRRRRLDGLGTAAGGCWGRRSRTARAAS